MISVRFLLFYWSKNKLSQFVKNWEAFQVMGYLSVDCDRQCSYYLLALSEMRCVVLPVWQFIGCYRLNIADALFVVGIVHYEITICEI